MLCNHIFWGCCCQTGGGLGELRPGREGGALCSWHTVITVITVITGRQ
jgi:hypothetical protein